jgi:predicted ATPase
VTKLLEIRIRGLRTLADVSLKLGGLTVLIGDNGTGKSTLLEALRFIRLIPAGKLIDELHRSHAIVSAVRRDCRSVQIDVRFEYEDRGYVYAIGLSPDAFSIETETLITLPHRGMSIVEGSELNIDQEFVWFRRVGTKVERGMDLDLQLPSTIGAKKFLLEVLAGDQGAPSIFLEAAQLFGGFDNHLPFDVAPVWAKRNREKSYIREPQLVEPGDRLVMFGDNLVNVYQTLRNDRSRSHWQDTLHLVRLGLGSDIEDIAVSAAGGGYTTLAVEFGSIGRVSALQLSDGILSYLAFVALVRLDEGRTLLAFDEPETHLHPALLARVMTLLDDAAERYPIVLSTHSDRLLDSLTDPVASVVLCELDAQHRTMLRRLDPQQFEKWRDDYLGVGDIRAESQLDSILLESAE